MYCMSSPISCAARSDIFLKIFRNLHRFDPMRGVKLTTWVYTIVKNHCFDFIKKRRIKTTSLEGKDGVIKYAIEPSDGEGYEPPSTALTSELGQQIHNALQDLVPDQRMVFVLREYEMLDYKAIAEALDLAFVEEAGRLLGPADRLVAPAD